MDKAYSVVLLVLSITAFSRGYNDVALVIPIPCSEHRFLKWCGMRFDLVSLCSFADQPKRETQLSTNATVFYLGFEVVSLRMILCVRLEKHTSILLTLVAVP